MKRVAALIITVALLGCTVKAEVEPGQQAQHCIALDGSDEFIIDPNDPQTEMIVGRFGAETQMRFVDKITGYRRVVNGEAESRYKCRPAALKDKP